MAKRKSALQLARDEIAELQRVSSELRNINSRLAIERREAQQTAQEHADKIGDLRAFNAAERQQTGQHRRALFRAIFILNLDLARKSGYIDRVRECDAGGSPEPIQSPVPGEIIDRCRDDLATATSEREVNRVIDGMDDETLEAVLGREFG